MSYLGVGVSPGNVPVYHSTDSRVVDRRVRVAELVLRFVVCALGILASVLVATDTQVKEIFSVEKKAQFKDMKALVYEIMNNLSQIPLDDMEKTKMTLSLLCIDFSLQVSGDNQWGSCFIFSASSFAVCCEYGQRTCFVQ